MRLGSAVVRSILQQNATVLIGFGAGIIIARLLTPAEFGAYSVAIALLFIAMALKDFGIASYMISATGDDLDLMASAFGLSLAMATAMAATLVALSWPLAGFYQNPVLGEVLRIAALAPFVLALVFPMTVALTRAMRFDALLVIGVAGAVAQATVSIGLSLLGHGPVALGWGYLASSVATASVTAGCAWALPRVAPSLRGWRRIAGFSGWMSATLAIGSTAASTPQLLIGRLMGLGEAALFSRAQNIVSLILNSFFFAVTRPMLAGLAAAERRDGRIAPLYLRIVEAVTGLAWPAYAALCVWATPLITALYGPAWSAAGALITPMAIGHALSLSVAPHHDVLVVKRRPTLLFRSELTIFLVTLSALLALTPFGLGTAVWALTFGGAFFAGWYFVVLRPVAGFRATDLFAVWGRSLTLALAALPGLILFRMLHDHGAMAFPVAFLASGLVAGALWLVAIRLTGHELRDHVNGVFNRMARPFREVSRGQA
jgi:O-antigen/teichoic acid export membrane protein